MLTLAAHNLYKGGPPDYSAWARTLNKLTPDVLLLQESSEPCKYRNKLTVEEQARVDNKLWSKAVTNYWGSAIYLAQGTATRLSLSPEVDGWIVAAEVQSLSWQPETERPLRIVSLHTPTDKASIYELDLESARGQRP